MVLEVSEDYFTETEEKDVKQRTGTVNCMIVTLILCIIAELIGPLQFKVMGVDVKILTMIWVIIMGILLSPSLLGKVIPPLKKVIGHAEVRQLFKASGVGTIAGSYVLDGTFQRNCKVRITRGEDQIFEGELASLKRFKDDVKEVRAGYECGLVFNDFNDVKEEDKVEAYIMVEVPR